MTKGKKEEQRKSRLLTFQGLFLSDSLTLIRAHNINTQTCLVEDFFSRSVDIANWFNVGSISMIDDD